MWTNKDAQVGPSARPASNPPSSTGQTLSYLGPGLWIKGEITGNEDVRLESQVEGSISIGGFRLTVGPNSHVNGEIVAREAVVSGKVTGNIIARDRLEIKNGSDVTGDLSTARIVIEDGAYFKGAVEVDRSNSQVGTDLDTLLGNAK
jgi:cytoskeletal protein CcmA (bactofilin family)